MAPSSTSRTRAARAPPSHRRQGPHRRWLLQQEDDHGRPHRAPNPGHPPGGALLLRGLVRPRLANAFQLHVSESLAFAVKRAGFLYGRVDAKTKEVLVDFIYEPRQQGSSDVVQLMRDADEEARMDAIANGLGMRRLGFVFTQGGVGRKASETDEYTMSNIEVVQAAQLQAEGGIPEWVTAVVKQEVGEDGSADVHFEAF
ncbi:hypothetical protein ZWY2020_025512 [Hordeum vulgare]|nr:hypothetical protein ZWY2020_025512 [Hordeum vulgare]